MPKLASFFLVLLLAACGSNEYKGQAFVANQSDTRKIADLEVRVIPYSALISGQEVYKKNIDRLLNELAQQTFATKQFETKLQGLISIIEILEKNGNIIKPSDPNVIKSARVTAEQIDEILKLKNERRKTRLKEVQEATYGGIYFSEKYSEEITSAKTDADGRFAIKVKNPKDLILVAHKDEH